MSARTFSQVGAPTWTGFGPVSRTREMNSRFSSSWPDANVAESRPQNWQAAISPQAAATSSRTSLSASTVLTPPPNRQFSTLAASELPVTAFAARRARASESSAMSWYCCIVFGSCIFGSCIVSLLSRRQLLRRRSHEAPGRVVPVALVRLAGGLVVPADECLEGFAGARLVTDRRLRRRVLAGAALPGKLLRLQRLAARLLALGLGEHALALVPSVERR